MWAGANPRTKGPRLYERDDDECYGAALETAALGESTDVLKRLKPSPEVDELGELLVCACIGGNTYITRSLLDVGASPNCKPNGGSAALGRWIWSIQMHASLNRRSSLQFSRFNPYGAFENIELLMERALFGSRTINSKWIICGRGSTAATQT